MSEQKRRRELSEGLDRIEGELEPRPPPPRVIFEIVDRLPATGGQPRWAGEAFERTPDRSIRGTASAYRPGDPVTFTPHERHHQE